MNMRRYTRYMFRILVISRHCGIVRFFRHTPGLVEFHFRSRGMRLRRRICCTLCRTGSSMNRFLPHMKIFNGSGFIEKNGGAESAPPLYVFRPCGDVGGVEQKLDLAIMLPLISPNLISPNRYCNIDRKRFGICLCM